MNRIFVALAAVLIALVGIAAAKDSHDRQYLSIQDQYKKDYPQSTFDSKAQQVFPVFSAAKRGDTFRTERCISCHVPDLVALGPQKAAERLVKDFLKYEPNHDQVARANGLRLVHPAFVTQELYAQYGQDSYATQDGFTPYTYQGQQVKLAGPLPSFLSPQANGGRALGIDQTGCVVCHNGGRLSLDDTAAHQNLIINPEYAFTAGAALYYKFCVTCHGTIGQGEKGPPLSNQDRLGFFNEDYYYRCIEYGNTGFEHLGSIMPAWGSQASDFHPDATTPPVQRQLSEDQIHLLVQFIRHWQDYQTLP